MTNNQSPRRRHRRGTAYLIVVGATMLVGITTFGVLQSSRARNRTTGESMDAAVARQCALDGVEAAKVWIRKDPNWRTNRPAGVWANNLAMGAGTVTIEASDPVDGILSKGQHDALLLKCTGKKGAAKSIVSVTLQAEPIPLPVLAYVAHTAGRLNVHTDVTLKASGGIVSSNDQLKNDGTITGGVHVSGVHTLGTITGSPIVTNAVPKVMPGTTAINKYIALGTTISTPTTIQKVALGPGNNPFGGGTNADGIYVINHNGLALTIKNCRIFGTLVIVTTGKVIFDDRVFIQPSRSDQPSLLVKGDAEFLYSSNGATLSETLNLTNFNPPGVPYNGATDSLILDSYPSEIQGLVHVAGKVTFNGTSRIQGALIVDDIGSNSLKFQGAPELIYTPSLFASPPQWYTKEVRMPILPGSWLQPAN